MAWLSDLSLHVRNMRESDLEAVAEIDRLGYSHPWTLGIFRDCLKAGYGALVLCHAEAVMGYGLVSTAVEESHLLNVCIHPDWQGKGLGRYMTEKLMDLARLQGGKSMFLEVRVSNLAAIALYEKLGFEPIGLRKDYYPAVTGREHARVMSRALYPLERSIKKPT